MHRIPLRKMFVFILFLTGLLLLGSGDLLAKQQPKLELKTTAEKEVKVKKQGKWVLERRPADKAAPGDVVVYTITYTNRGTGTMTDAVIVNPVPNGMRVNPESAAGKDAAVTCSIDNGHSYHPPPIMVPMKKPDGSLESNPAPLDRYTHIRWLIKRPVQPGESGQVSFKATVS